MAGIAKSIEVSNCPIKLEVCFPSCFWRKEDRCIFYSKRGRRIVRRLARKEHSSVIGKGLTKVAQ